MNKEETTTTGSSSEEDNSNKYLASGSGVSGAEKKARNINDSGISSRMSQTLAANQRLIDGARQVDREE